MGYGILCLGLIWLGRLVIYPWWNRWISGNFGSLRSGVWGTDLVMARFSSKSLLHDCWSTEFGCRTVLNFGVSLEKIKRSEWCFAGWRQYQSKRAYTNLYMLSMYLLFWTLPRFFSFGLSSSQSNCVSLIDQVWSALYFHIAQ